MYKYTYIQYIQALQAQYSRSYPNISCSRYNSSLVNERLYAQPPSSLSLLYFLCRGSCITLFCTTYTASRRILREHVHFLAMDVYRCPERAPTSPSPSNGCPSIVERLCHGNVTRCLAISQQYESLYNKRWDSPLNSQRVVHKFQ
jgi:hypothetical protein